MADTPTDAHGAAANGADAAGMPQLDFATFPNQIFWLVVALVAIYLILSRIALPRIAGILADRQDTIANDLGTAEELKLKAQQAEVAYQKALADARTEAQRIVKDTRAAMQADLDDAIAKADAAIAERTADSEKAINAIRATALESVEAVAKDTTGAIVAALGGQTDDAAVRAAVDARLKG